MSLKNRKTQLFAVVAIAIIGVVLFWQFYYVPSQQDSLQMALVVEYEDGTEQRFKRPALSLLPLTIRDGTDKTVKNVRFELYATVDYTGEPVSWSATGAIIQRIKRSGTTFYSAPSVPLSASAPTAPPRNQAFLVYSKTTLASDIESMPVAWLPGQLYALSISVQDFTFTITATDGTQSSKTLDTGAVNAMEWSFKYVSGAQLSSISVSWQAAPGY